ncbi:MAG: site-specific integrase [Alistipes senegalensis]|nr:site-specific integrase [Alistipes senegalensis]
MQGRTTVYNKITTPEKIAQINKDNVQLVRDFAEYLASVDRSPQTISQYKNDLNVFFVWNLEYNDNKPFIKITKRELTRFQNLAINEWRWSSSRIRRVKSVISSLSAYIENILDEEEEFKDFRSIVKKIESPTMETVREKTILTDEQVETLLDVLVERKEYEKAVAVSILCNSGMRKAELLQMKMEYFTPEHLEFNCLYKTDKIRAKGRGVKGKQINKYIMNKVDKYMDLWIQQRKELGIESPWVFVVKHNEVYERRVNINNWRNEFSAIIHAPFYFHCLRHKLCSELVANNIPTEVIREFFRWESAEMISIYNDNSAVDDFGKYFSAEGIVQQKNKNITEV